MKSPETTKVSEITAELMIYGHMEEHFSLIMTRTSN
jgi:hypothetical protein